MKFQIRVLVYAVITFFAKIEKIGINPVIDPPDDVLRSIFEQAGKSKGPIPVCGKLNGAKFLQTLVKYQGAWRLYVNGPMLNSSRLKVGDIAEVELQFDPRPREVPMPEKLETALKKNRNARRIFEDLAPSRQKEILRYLGSLRSAESIQRNVDRVIAQLCGDGPDAPVFMRKR